MLRNRITRTLAAAVAAGTLAVVGASPAMAGPIDDPLVNTSSTDFGNSWSNQVPTSGATLDWDTGNGNTCLDGNLYMKNLAGVTAQVEFEIYSGFPHTGEQPLATTKSKKKTAVGNALNTFPVNVPCQNSPGTHAHIRVLDDSSNIGGGLVLRGEAIEDE